MHHALFAAAAVSLLAAAPAWAQQQTTRPSTTQNESQAQTNQGQQPSIAREVAPTAPTASESGVTKPQGPTTGPTSQGPQGRSQ